VLLAGLSIDRVPAISTIVMSALGAVQATASIASCHVGRKPWASKDVGTTRMHLKMNALASSLNGSAFNGIRLQVRTPANVRNHRVGVRVRAAGAKGDYLVQKVSARELDDILANERSSPMVVDFYATWCGPCMLLAQELEQLAVEYGDRVRFLKIDTDEEHELANQMQIRGLPTMVFVSPDTEKLAIRTEGLLPTNTIRDIIEKEL